MTKKSLLIVISVLVIGIGLGYYSAHYQKWNTPDLPGVQQDRTPVSEPAVPDKNNLIRITSPTANQVVTSPFTITGQARGTWFFEASFPIQLVDANGRVLGTAIAQAQGDWMTTEFVPFQTQMTFTNPATSTGTLIFEKDNPSGLPEHADELRIPVRFQ
jgi:hypothetical protein